MGKDKMHEALADTISQALEQEVSIIAVEPLSGGSINQVSCLSLDNGSRYLLKTQTNLNDENTFQIEFDSLLLLAETGTLRVPMPLLSEADCLVMEYIQPGVKASDWAEQLGQQLALLHQKTQRAQFGFDCDNYLGTSLQVNTWQDNWLDFWREKRLGFQLQLFAKVAEDDPLIRKGERLLERLERYLGDMEEPAVLLHGDLWSGNAMADESGAPVIFDPACYYGHREAEFGMMRLFGGFGMKCEAAYEEVWPFAEGHEERFRLYQLYHELNHLNLFGGSYYNACMDSVNALL